MMCLLVDKKISEDFWNTEERKGKTWCWGYKIYEIKDRQLQSVYFPKFFRSIIWGEIKSNRESQKSGTDVCDKDDIINRGVHVCLNPYSVARWKGNILYNYPWKELVDVKVRCYKKDFIAADDFEDAVFMKIRLSRAEYRKAIKCGK